MFGFFNYNDNIILSKIIEYIATEILEKASNCARHFKKIKITLNFIEIAIKEDRELNDLYNNNLFTIKSM